MKTTVIHIFNNTVLLTYIIIYKHIILYYMLCMILTAYKLENIYYTLFGFA